MAKTPTPRKPRTTRSTATPRAKKAAPRLPKTIQAVIDAAQGRKATDTVVLDLRKAAAFTDYFVICTGTNPRQVQAIADAIEEALKAQKQRPSLVEGYARAEWILLDYFDFVVHVFSKHARDFYGLDRLWGNAVRIEVKDLPVTPSGAAAANAILAALFAPPCAVCARALRSRSTAPCARHAGPASCPCRLPGPGERKSTAIDSTAPPLGEYRGPPARHHSRPEIRCATLDRATTGGADARGGRNAARGRGRRACRCRCIRGASGPAASTRPRISRGPWGFRSSACCAARHSPRHRSSYPLTSGTGTCATPSRSRSHGGDGFRFPAPGSRLLQE